MVVVLCMLYGVWCMVYGVLVPSPPFIVYNFKFMIDYG